MEVECTWAEGPDIIVSLNGHSVILYENPKDSNFEHGIINKGSFDLTKKEAYILAYQLIKAANQATELEDSAREYFERSQK